MEIFDTHCHYNMSPLYENWQDHWQKAQEHGVIGAVVVGTNIETSKRAIEIGQQAEKLLAAVGIHPHEYTDVQPRDLPTLLTAHQATLTMLIKQSEKVVAIGETGLDYFRLDDKTREVVINNQKQAFRMHVQLANEFKLPLIIHVRDQDEQAYWDVLEILKAEYSFQRPFILHCLSGPVEYVKQALEMDAYTGIAGNVTYGNADHLRELVKMVPDDRLLSETDAPFLPPVPYRGQTCEPWMISETVKYLQESMGISATIEQNAQKIFSPAPSSH